MDTAKLRKLLDDRDDLDRKIAEAVGTPAPKEKRPYLDRIRLPGGSKKDKARGLPQKFVHSLDVEGARQTAYIVDIADGNPSIEACRLQHLAERSPSTVRGSPRDECNRSSLAESRLRLRPLSRAAFDNLPVQVKEVFGGHFT